MGFSGGCLGWERWVALFAFCEKAGCQIYFSVNALRGRTRATCANGTLCRERTNGTRPSCCTSYSGTWDGDNLRQLLRASAAAGLRPAGLAFGNELVGAHAIEARVPAAQYATEVLEMAEIVREAWPLNPPLILAPDANWDEAWYAAFLGNLSWPAPLAPADEAAATTTSLGAAAAVKARARPPVDVLTHHMYPLGAGNLAEMHSKLLSPRHLDGSAERLKQVARLVRNRTGGAAEVALSETGGAYNSGQRGTTDAFASCFWWADLLGSLAKHEHAMGCRQALVGGRYALVELAGERRGLAPDFYLLMLWRQLMSPKVA